MQREVGRLLSVFWIPASVFILRVLMGYKIRDVKQVRRRFRALVRETRGPILMCPNHLTMADSAILAWALGGPWWLLTHFRWVPWNVPELSNFAGVGLDRAAAWMVKCIPIVRGGPRERLSHALRKIEYVLSRGETALIFAEGARSRTGRIQAESTAHGVGRIVSAIPECQVLCAYLRGDAQETWSTIPARGDTFYVDFELFRPESEHSGMRRSRDFAHQVTDRLVKLEEKYFAGRSAA